MSEERTPAGADPDENGPSWLERISQLFQGQELKDRRQLAGVVKEALERNLVDHDAYKMILGALEVSEKQVRHSMVARSQMVVIQRDQRLEEFLPIVIESAHSRFPVIGENRDEVLGILLAKDLLRFALSGEAEKFDIRDVIRPPLVVPESKRLNTLLTDFRTSRNHMAIVVDEYGGIAGLVTIEDVLEEIVGDIEDEYDVDEDEHEIVNLGDYRYSVHALTPVDEFNEYFGTQLSDDEFDTVGGLVMNTLGHLPKVCEEAELAGFLFSVTKADRRRIHLLEVISVPAAEAAAGVTDGDGDTA